MDWLQSMVTKECDEGSISGYVTKPKESEQLENYLMEMGAFKAVPIIESRYDRIGILKNMWVEEEYRGNGVGTWLLHRFVEEAADKHAEAILLVADTGERNDFDLVDWYKRNGFEVVFGKEEAYPVMIKVVGCEI